MKMWQCAYMKLESNVSGAQFYFGNNDIYPGRISNQSQALSFDGYSCVPPTQRV